jgi:hypothetical protein
MTFKIYDILASLIPGFLVLIILFYLIGIDFDKDLIIPYTAIAFFIGFIVNTLSSWLEDLYYLTWKGKPSSRLINGKGIWKVKFYHSSEIKILLKKETLNTKPSDDELFGIAMRHANASKDNRVEDFNSSYAFSRSLLTCILISVILLFFKERTNWYYYVISFPLLFIVWLRCKQRAYYYAKEVLNTYLKAKQQ